MKSCSPLTMHSLWRCCCFVPPPSFVIACSPHCCYPRGEGCVAPPCTSWSWCTKFLLPCRCLMGMDAFCPSVGFVVLGEPLSWGFLLAVYKPCECREWLRLCCSPNQRKKKSQVTASAWKLHLIQPCKKLHGIPFSLSCWPQGYVRLDLVCLVFLCCYLFRVWV